MNKKKQNLCAKVCKHKGQKTGTAHGNGFLLFLLFLRLLLIHPFIHPCSRPPKTTHTKKNRTQRQRKGAGGEHKPTTLQTTARFMWLTSGWSINLLALFLYLSCRFLCTILTTTDQPSSISYGIECVHIPCHLFSVSAPTPFFIFDCSYSALHPPPRPQSGLRVSSQITPETSTSLLLSLYVCT